jgi:hypothetical protein
MYPHNSKYSEHAFKSANQIYFTVWFGENDSELPLYIRRIIKWNAKIFKRNKIPFVFLYKGNRIGKQLLKMDQSIIKVDVSNLMQSANYETLFKNFKNERETQSKFELMCFQRFMVASSLFKKTNSELVHIDCDFMLSEKIIHETEYLENYQIASLGTGCTPLVYFKNTNFLNDFCGYFTQNIKKCDMVALKDFLETENVKFTKINLSTDLNNFIKNNSYLSFSIRANIEKLCKQRNIKIPNEKNNKDFLKTISEFFEFENRIIKFENKEIPFAHFQGWTRFVAKYIFTNLF